MRCALYSIEFKNQTPTALKNSEIEAIKGKFEHGLSVLQKILNDKGFQSMEFEVHAWVVFKDGGVINEYKNRNIMQQIQNGIEAQKSDFKKKVEVGTKLHFVKKIIRNRTPNPT